MIPTAAEQASLQSFISIYQLPFHSFHSYISWQKSKYQKRFSAIDNLKTPFGSMTIGDIPIFRP